MRPSESSNLSDSSAARSLLSIPKSTSSTSPDIRSVGGQELVDLCVEQGLQYGADVRLGEEIAELERSTENGEELLFFSTNAGNKYASRVIIVTAGHGAFEPRKLPVESVDDWQGKGLHYFVREKHVFADKTCVIVGGGDSALDWTLGLQDTAKLPITLVHRRTRFRALESSVNEARKLESEGKVRIVTPAEVRDIAGDGAIHSVTIENTESEESLEVECDALITLLGFHSHLGAIAEWGPRLPRQAPDPRRAEDHGDLAGWRLCRG